MPPATKNGLDKAKADFANKNAGGTNNNNKQNKSVTINGKVVTDPKKVATIEKNRAASAMYAAKDYKEQGTPIPKHLKEEVNRQAAVKAAADAAKAKAKAAAAAATPAPAPKPLLGGFTGIKDMIDGGGKNNSGPVFVGGLAPIANMVGLKPLGSGNNNNTAQALLPKPLLPKVTPSPGPNYYAPLGVPGKARESNNPIQSGEAAPLMAAPSIATAAPEVIEPAPAAPISVDDGNAPTEDGDAVSRANAERSRVPSYEEGGMVGPNGMPQRPIPSYEAGGMVGPNGMPQRPSTTSLDLPPALARMLALPMQSYAEGGMVGPGGVPQRPMEASPMAMNLAQQGGAPVVGLAPQGSQGRPLNFAAIDQQAQQFMQQNPQQVEEIRAEVQDSIASGEVDPSSLNTFVQIATVSLQNPEMWPQLRQVLIQQGMLDAEDVSEQYDQGFLIILYIIGKTMGSGQAATPMPGGQPPMSAGQTPQMSMSEGGALPEKSENEDGSIPINAHEGEYVIPADVTRRLGTDHFDRLIAKARDVDTKGER